MLKFPHCGVWLAVIAMMAMTGCASHPNPPPKRAAWEPPLLPVKAQAAPSEREQVDQRLVEAYAHYAQGMIYDMEEQSDLAQAELAKAAIGDPSNEDLVLELTRRYLAQKQPEQALEILNRTVAQPKASGAIFARLAVVYSRLGKEDQALDACQTAIKRSPDMLDGYRTLFFLKLQKGKPKEALKVLDQAMHVPNTSAEFAIGLVELCGTLEREAPSEKAAIDANALAALSRIAEKNSLNPQLRLKLADDYNVLGDTTNAETIYLQLLESQNEIPGIREKLVDIYWRQKQYDKAKEQLKVMVEVDPANVRSYYLLGTLAAEDHDFAAAKDYFHKALLLNSDEEELYYDVALAQINLNQPKDALETLDQAKKHPKFKGGFYPEWLAAMACVREKDFTNALSHFTAAEVVGKATEPDRLTGGFYFDEGAAYERAGVFDQAEKCFEKSLQIAPNVAETLNYLGYMWADRGVKLERARELIEKALRLEPKSAAYLDSLGWVLYKLNKPQEALPNLQKAIELSEEPDATLFDHLGDIYAALRQQDKARDAWNKSIAVEPNEEVKKKLHSDGSSSTH